MNDPSRYDNNEKLLFENRFRELKSSVNVLKNQENQSELPDQPVRYQEFF